MVAAAPWLLWTHVQFWSADLEAEWSPRQLLFRVTGGPVASSKLVLRVLLMSVSLCLFLLPTCLVSFNYFGICEMEANSIFYLCFYHSITLVGKAGKYIKSEIKESHGFSFICHIK